MSIILKQSRSGLARLMKLYASQGGASGDAPISASIVDATQFTVDLLATPASTETVTLNLTYPPSSTKATITAVAKQRLSLNLSDNRGDVQLQTIFQPVSPALGVSGYNHVLCLREPGIRFYYTGLKAEVADQATSLVDFDFTHEFSAETIADVVQAQLTVDIKFIILYYP